MEIGTTSGNGKSSPIDVAQLVKRMLEHSPNALTRWWMVDSNGKLFPPNQVCIMEMYKSGDHGLKKFVVDGNGDLWLPDLARNPEHCIGRLLASWDGAHDFPIDHVCKLVTNREVLLMPANK